MNHPSISLALQQLAILQQAAKASLLQSQLLDLLKQMNAQSKLKPSFLPAIPPSISTLQPNTQVIPSLSMNQSSFPNQFLFKEIQKQIEDSIDQSSSAQESSPRVTSMSSQVSQNQLERLSELMFMKLQGPNKDQKAQLSFQNPPFQQPVHISHPHSSTHITKSLDDNTYDQIMASSESLSGTNLPLDYEIEASFSVSVQKKRRRLVEILQTKRDFELIIKPHKKAFKG